MDTTEILQLELLLESKFKHLAILEIKGESASSKFANVKSEIATLTKKEETLLYKLIIGNDLDKYRRMLKEF